MNWTNITDNSTLSVISETPKEIGNVATKLVIGIWLVATCTSVICYFLQYLRYRSRIGAPRYNVHLIASTGAHGELTIIEALRKPRYVDPPPSYPSLFSNETTVTTCTLTDDAPPPTFEEALKVPQSEVLPMEK